MKVKTERYANLLLKEINDILYNEIRDIDITGTTATYVKLADDLSYAKVYCSVFQKEKKVKKDKSLIECRPICSFDIKIKIINTIIIKHILKD